VAREMGEYRSQYVIELISDRRKKGKKGEFNMAEHEKPQGHFFTGFLIGGVLGALAGIFFAPKSGKELRSDIKEKGSEVLKDAKEIYADASTKAKEIIEEAKHQAEKLKKEADRYLSEARQKAQEILARGEK
jgi:gas vesicle protein